MTRTRFSFRYLIALLRALSILQVTAFNARSKRSASSESDVSSSESDASSSESDDVRSDSDDSASRESGNTTPAPIDDVSTESDSTTSIECPVLSNYIEFDLSIPLFVPESFLILTDVIVNFNISVITQTAPEFFALLTSAPTLLANISLGIEIAADQIVIPPTFSANPNVTEAVSSFNALVPDFLAVANDTCNISLTEQQVDDVTRLFDVVLSIFFISDVECGLFNQPAIEQAVAAADFNDGFGDLAVEFQTATTGFITLHSERLFIDLINILNNDIPDVPAGAQMVLDEFLFLINDFCGIPPLSNAALMQLDEYFANFAAVVAGF